MKNVNQGEKIKMTDKLCAVMIFLMPFLKKAVMLVLRVLYLAFLFFVLLYFVLSILWFAGYVKIVLSEAIEDGFILVTCFLEILGAFINGITAFVAWFIDRFTFKAHIVFAVLHILMVLAILILALIV